MEHEMAQGPSGKVPAFDLATFRERWRIFLLRRTLVLHDRLGLLTNVGPLAVEIPPLPELIASLLYVDLVSLLEEGVSSQMSRTKFEALEDLKGRIDHLADTEKVLDREALQRIRRRRNEIAHRIERVPAAELAHALAAVHRQLEAWELVGPIPRYGFFTEHGAGEPSDREGFIFKSTVRVGVKHEGQVVLEYSWTEYLAKD
jgi:hypothetical protein